MLMVAHSSAVNVQSHATHCTAYHAVVWTILLCFDYGNTFDLGSTKILIIGLMIGFDVICLVVNCDGYNV